MTTEPEPLTESNWRQITELLPSLAATDPPQSLWTEEELSRAYLASCRRLLKAGFRWENGRFVKPVPTNWRQEAAKIGVVMPKEIEARPTALMPSLSGQESFNPKRDATAVRMGAEFVSDNRYRMGATGYVDRNGQFVWAPTEECYECGGLNRYVKTRRGLPLDAKRYRYNLTYCRRCTTADELEAIRKEREEAQAQPQKAKPA